MSRIILSCLFVLAGVGTGVQPLLAQSLADVAKKESDRRQTIHTPAKVYTNKDLGAVPPGPPPPANAPQAAKDAGKADTETPGKDTNDSASQKTNETKDKDAKGKEAPARDQAYWAGRLTDLRTQVDRNQGYADAMQTRLSSLNADFVNRDDPVQRAAIDRDRQNTQAELARLTKAVQEGKKAVADFLEEARRAGVPPGWLR